MAQKNDGKLIEHLTQKLIIGTVGLSRSAVQAKAVEFPQSLSYPYTFTIMAANREHGEAGEGNFIIQIFTKDHDMAIQKLN
jgi:hypothetical protein